MRILFIIKKLSNAAGGAERFCRDLSAELANRGHNVRIVCFDSVDEAPFYELSHEVELIKLERKDPVGRSSLVKFLEGVFMMRRYVNQNNHDVVIGVMVNSYATAAFSFIGKSKNVIGSDHIILRHYNERPIEKILLYISSLFLRKIVFNSKEIIEDLPFWIRNKSVPIGIPICFSPNLQKESGKIGKKLTLLSVGRLDSQKSHDVLIRSFISLAPRFPDWKLRIVGEGPERSALAMIIDTSGFQDRIELVGTKKDVANEYANASLFALASRYESFGLVVAEAMLSERAVVAFADCPGVNALVSHGATGLLVAGDDRVAALASGLASLMADKPRRDEMGRAGRLAMEGRHDLRKVADQWEALIVDVAGVEVSGR